MSDTSLAKHRLSYRSRYSVRYFVRPRFLVGFRALALAGERKAAEPHVRVGREALDNQGPDSTGVNRDLPGLGSLLLG
jgi:hypothetical protein